MAPFPPIPPAFRHFAPAGLLLAAAALLLLPIAPLSADDRLAPAVLLILAAAGLFWMALDRRGKARSRVIWSLLAILVGMLRVGYEYDRHNYVLYHSLIEHARDPSFLATDWFVRASAGFNGYYFFVRACALLPPALLPPLFFGLWLLGFAALALLFRLIAHRIIPRFARAELCAAAAYLFVLLTYAPGRWSLVALGDHGFFYPFVNPQVAGMLLGLLAAFLIAAGRPLAGSLPLGLAINLHLSSGQHFFILCAVLVLLARPLQLPLSLPRGLAALALALLIGLPNLLPTLRNQLAAPPTPETDIPYILIFGYFRHPHHTIPSTWPLKRFICFGIVLALGAAGWLLKRPHGPLDRAHGAIVATCLLLMFAGWFFVERTPIDFVGKSQFFRLSVVAQILCAPYIAWLLARPLPLPRNIASLDSTRLKRHAWALAATIALVAAGVALGRPFHLVARPGVPVEQWVAKNTPPDAVFILPIRTYGIGLNEFPMRTGRGLVADLHRFPHQGVDYLTWFKRLCDLFGVECDLNPKAVRALGRANLTRMSQQLSLDQLRQLRDRYGATHLVRQVQYPLAGRDPVYRDQEFLVYDLRPAAE